MQEALKKNFQDAISEVLETMFFLCPEPMDAGDDQPGGPAAGTGMTVHIATVEAAYRVVLRLTDPLLREMSATILEQEGDMLGREEMQDVACELANMVAGALISRLDLSDRCRLSLPEPLPDFPDKPEGWLSYCRKVSGEPLQAYLQCKGDT